MIAMEGGVILGWINLLSVAWGTTEAYRKIRPSTKD
jgi:hypothetical protein